jgi:endonuclease G
MNKKIIISILVFSGFCLFSQSSVNYASPKITKKDSVLLEHKGFTISYNPETKNANWVSYRLIKKEVSQKIERSDNFKKDPLYSYTATNQDYYKSNYDKGHLFPAGSSWTDDIMNESFYYTNMSPQAPSLNRGKWKEIETIVRYWASLYDTIYVVTGTVFDEKVKKIKTVSVPSAFFKLVLVYTSKKQQAIVFFCANEGSKKSIQEYTMSIDDLENLTGLDFCASLDKR